MSTAILAPVRRAEPSAPAARSVLPGWPLYLMIGGYPLWWALGVTAFSGTVFAAIMLLLLALHGRRSTLIPGVLPWAAFSAWVLASAVQLTSLLEAVGYVQRLADILAVGIALVYYVNARERIPPVKLLGSLVVLWAATVLLGVLATRFPDVRLTTPLSYLLPRQLTDNALVYNMVYPPLAEVQRPWGAPESYNRPAAPFPYANSWGAAYAILTPVVLAFLATRPAAWVRGILILLLAVSIWPAVQTSNRGMLLTLGIAVGYAAVRLALRGRVGALAGVVAGGVLAVGFLLASGALDAILGRQEYSDSTGGRASIYTATFLETLKSPFLGWAVPESNATIGVALGTQGHAWTLMYSYGFVGLGLFLLFLVGAALRTMRAPTTPRLWLHASLVAVIPMIWFYGLGTAQLLSVALIAAILLRSRYLAEATP